MGAVSLGGVDTFHKLSRPLLFETTFVNSPNEYYHPAGKGAGDAVLAEIDSALSAAPGEYCGVFIEPLIQAAGGMLTHPRGFLSALCDLTWRHDVLLIADEVARGFCRTGKLFACDHESVRPDLRAWARPSAVDISPVAATLASREIFDSFKDTTFYHGHTFAGNALGCAAAVASVDLIFSSGLLESLPAKVELISRKLAVLADHPNVGDIRHAA